MFKSSKNKLISRIKNQLSSYNYGAGLQLHKCAFSTLIALGVIFAPLNMVAEASNLTKSDDGIISSIIQNVLSKNKVHNIYADKANEKVAINHFKNFQLSENEIANLYFKTSADSKVEASTLLNFVDKQIDIAGTVNAVKNAKIGGNLYFISANGMIVQSTGVINAGALTVIAPTKDSYEKLLPKDDIGIQSAMDALSAQTYAINSSATIVVNGKINTTNGVNLQAGNVNIGDMSSTANSKAEIKTGVINFSDLVNIHDIEGKVIVDSGLTGDLKAVKTDNGNIVLKATGITNNGALTSNDGKVVINASGDFTNNGEVSAAKGSVELTVGQNFNNNSVIDAGKDISITTSNVLNNAGVISAENDVKIVSTNGDVINNGTITSGNSISLKADAGNLQIANMLSAGGSISLDAADTISINGNADIQADADIDITAQDISILTDITAAESADISASGELYNSGSLQVGKNINMTADSLINSGSISSDAGDVVLMAISDLVNSGDISASKGSISLAAEQNLENYGSLNADASVTMHAVAGLTNMGTIEAGQNVSLISENNDVLNDGFITSGKDTILNSKFGNIKILKGIFSGKNLNIRSKGNISICDSISAFGPVMLCADFGEISMVSAMASAPVMLMSVNASVDVVAEKNITLSNVEAKSEVCLNSSKGDIGVANIEANTVGLKTSTGNVKVASLKATKTTIETKDKVLNLAPNQQSINYNTITDIIEQILPGNKEDKPSSGADEPYLDPDFEKDLQEYQKNTIENIQKNASFLAMLNEYGENKDTEQVQFVYYNRFHLYELPKEEEAFKTADGTLVISENKALTNSVEEKKEEKKS